MYDDYTRRYGRDDDERYSGDDYAESPRIRVDATTLWAGGLATALVAVLTSFVGVLIARGIFGLAVLGPEDAGVAGDASTVGLAALAALAAVLATGLMHLLLLSTPSPQAFFTAIIGLLTVLLALQPFLTDADLIDKVASMLIYAATGAVIGALLSSVANYAARRVVPRRRPRGGYPDRSRGYPEQTRDYGDQSRGYDPDRYRGYPYR